MIEILKAKMKKIILLISGRFNHLKTGIEVTKTWYGNAYGGFFIAPESLNDKSVVYSFGIGEDISFDKAIILNHNCSVFGFDPTPKSINWIKDQQKTLPSRFTFLEYGIGDKSGFVNFYLPKNRQHVSGSLINQANVDEQQSISVEMKSLTDIASQLGHKKIDVLKMDIEGAEYRVLESVLKSDIPINQILVEFHERFFEDGKLRTINSINKMRDHGYEIFGISDSFDEVSFIRKNVM